MVIFQVLAKGFRPPGALLPLRFAASKRTSDCVTKRDNLGNVSVGFKKSAKLAVMMEGDAARKSRMGADVVTAAPRKRLFQGLEDEGAQWRWTMSPASKEGTWWFGVTAVPLQD